MSTPMYERKTENNENTQKLTALVKAQELAQYTLDSCQNEKKFKPELDRFLAQRIVDTANNIYIYADCANCIRVDDDVVRWHERKRLQELATENCNELFSLIHLAHHTYHLRGKKISHWIQMNVDVLNYLQAWKKKDEERFDYLDE